MYSQGHPHPVTQSAQNDPIQTIRHPSSRSQEANLQGGLALFGGQFAIAVKMAVRVHQVPSAQDHHHAEIDRASTFSKYAAQLHDREQNGTAFVREARGK